MYRQLVSLIRLYCPVSFRFSSFYFCFASPPYLHQLPFCSRLSIFGLSFCMYRQLVSRIRLDCPVSFRFSFLYFFIAKFRLDFFLLFLSCFTTIFTPFLHQLPFYSCLSIFSLSFCMYRQLVSLGVFSSCVSLHASLRRRLKNLELGQCFALTRYMYL